MGRGDFRHYFLGETNSISKRTLTNMDTTDRRPERKPDILILALMLDHLTDKRDFYYLISLINEYTDECVDIGNKHDTVRDIINVVTQLKEYYVEDIVDLFRSYLREKGRLNIDVEETWSIHALRE